jgi:hypothetical protein
MQRAERGWKRKLTSVPAGQNLCGAPRRNRTADTILTIDAPEVHDAVQHLASPYNRAGERWCRGLGRGAWWGRVWQSFWQIFGTPSNNQLRRQTLASSPQRGQPIPSHITGRPKLATHPGALLLRRFRDREWKETEAGSGT